MKLPHIVKEKLVTLINSHLRPHLSELLGDRTAYPFAFSSTKMNN